MISIIIPAHNEEKRIGKTLEEYGRFFEKKRKNKEIKDFEIIVVLNACRDRTIDVVKKAEKRYRKIRHLDFEKGGKGFAVIEGFKEALKGKSNFIGIGFVDADMATSPEAFYDLIKNIRDYDGVIASRYIKGAVVSPKQSIQRVIVSRVFNFLIRALYFMPYRDTQCGAKIFRREAVESILPSLGLTQWAFDVDLLYHLKKKGFKVREFPTIWMDKEYSKLNFIKVSPRMAISIIRLRIIHSPFRFIARIYDRLPEWIKIHHRIK